MKIICVENNNPQCFVEANESVKPSFFMKPDTALLRNNETFYIPSFGSDFRCSVELVIKSNRVAKAIKPRFVERCFDEIGLAINFEATDQIELCYENNSSCDYARAFDHSSAMSPAFVAKSDFEELSELVYELRVDDLTVEKTKLGDLFFGIDTAVSHISDFVTLKIGDLILMGSAAEKIKISQGSRIEALLDGRVMLKFEIR